MNKYRIKTVEENGKFVGYVLNNDEVVYASSPQETSTLASIQVTKYINEQTSRPLSQPSGVTNNITITAPQQVVSQAPSVPQPPPRRCCGRG